MRKFSFKKLMLFLAMSFLAGNAYPQQITLHYFDNEYRLGNSINEAFESLKSEKSKISLENTVETLSFTNGATFLLGNVNSINAAALNGAQFRKTGEIAVIHEGVNYIFLDEHLKTQTLRSNAPELNILADFLEAEIGKAEIMSGRLADGTEVQAIHIPGEKSHEFWENTMQLEHTLKMGGNKPVFRTVIKPQGLMSPRLSAVNAAKSSGSHALISIGAGAAIMSEGNPSAFDGMYQFFNAAGTQILLLNPEDLPGVKNSLDSKNNILSGSKPEMVFTNADFKDTVFEGLVKQYAALQINGKKVLFFSAGPDSEAIETKLDGSGIKFWNPADSKKMHRIIKKAREKENADAVILSNAYAENESGWTEGLKGVDLIINRKRWGKTANREIKADLEARTDRHDSAISLNRDRHGDGKIELFFNEKGLSALHLDEEDGPNDIFMPEEREAQKTAILRAFISDENAVMPDAADMQYAHEQGAFQSPADFMQAAAGLLRRHYGAEAAALLINADPSRGITGYLAADEAREWLGRNEQARMYYVPGKFLKTITGSKAAPMTFKDYAAAKAAGKTLYAVSGLDGKGRLSGMAIRDDEIYSAVLPESLAAKCGDAKDAGKPPVKVVSFVINEMKEIRKNNPEKENWKKASLAAAMDRTPSKGTWRFEIADLNFYAEKTHIHSPEGYSNTNESAFGTKDRTKISASGLIKAPYVKGDFFFTPSISGSYGKTKYENYTGLDSDRLDYNAEFMYAPFTLKALGSPAMHGFLLTAEYETEFEAENNYEHRKKIFRQKTGWKMFEGKYIKEAYTAFDVERGIYPGDPYTHYAFEAFAKGAYKIPHTNLTFEANVLYRRYLPCHDDDSSKLRERLEANAALMTKIYGNISMGFYSKWIYATGAKLNGYADSFTFGGTVNYKFLAKWL